MDIRLRIEKEELSNLSQYAAKSKHSKGRKKKEEPSQIRTDFQRDRDRIVHSKSFRRLMYKTQVFIAPKGDHYRNRLTHTIEISQIARTISKALKLNEDLAEAITLGHDLGHTPFGHTGESVLNEICPLGFKHYEQSVRVCEFLENGQGLNLTYEVLDGIENHSGEHVASTLEGKIIKLADRIAYINHDIDDALRAEILKKEDLPKRELKILGDTHSKRINTLISDIVLNSYEKADIHMSEEILESMMRLRKFLFEKVYNYSPAKKEDEKAKNVMTSLYAYFVKNKDKLPHEYKKMLTETEIDRVVCDYIAGMTDRYAISLYSDIFIPKSWNLQKKDEF